MLQWFGYLNSIQFGYESNCDWSDNYSHILMDFQKYLMIEVFLEFGK